MNEVISAFDIITALACCDEGLKKCNVAVSYENDMTRNNAVIFVRDTVILNGNAIFTINVRGFKNNGKSTAAIVGELIKFNEQYITLDIHNNLYQGKIWFENATGSGVDDVGRTIIVLDVQVQNFRKIRNEE